MSAKPAVIVSMLHELADSGSAVRTFRGEPVIGWTLKRLARSKETGAVSIVCWDDQAKLIESIASRATVVSMGARHGAPTIDAVSAAQRWSDGWRGGLLQTCHFDPGFDASAVKRVLEETGANLAVLVDPAAALVDAELVDALVEQATRFEAIELFFSQAPPGLCGCVIRRSLLERLAKGNIHPGRIIHYLPDQPARDPISLDSCIPIPTPVARSLDRFSLDSDRQIQRISKATESLNGQLIGTNAEGLVKYIASSAAADDAPREVVLELTTRRSTRPVYSATSHLPVERADLTPELASKMFAQLGKVDDLRLTLAGVGDPLLNPSVLEIIALAKDAGISAIHLETDLLDCDASLVQKLVEARIDIVSVSIPSVTPETYQAVMGVEGLSRLLENIRQFIIHRQSISSGVPILVPTFVKCQQNLAEMETWYDQWIRALGSAVIQGPSDFAGQIPGCAVADMTPPVRRACARLTSRMTILSDGKIVACEQDVLGKHPLGNVADDSIMDVWQKQFGKLRDAHGRGQWNSHGLCGACREWHRP